VLVNLLGNAAKYGRKGGAVRLTVVRDPDRLEVSVWNEGPGFSPEDRGKLFRRFSRLHQSEFKGVRGTGVGLYNAWRIIQLHKGRIRARSERGSWAEFAFELSQPLPLDATSSGRDGSASSAGAATPAGAASSDGSAPLAGAVPSAESE
jgi:signal transduction histidine kinase